MRNFFSIRSQLLGLITALLILMQSFVATGLPALHPEVKKPEVKKEITSKVNYVEVVARISVPLFFFYWISKTFVVNIPDIRFDNCIALFVPPHSFSTFYIFTSVHAP